MGNKAGNAAYPVYVTNAKKVNLLLPDAMSGSVDCLQLLTGTYGKNSFSIQVYLHADTSGLSADLLNDFGTDMGSLQYGADGTVTFTSAIFPSSLKPQYILLDFQNVYYDVAALKAHYALSNLIFASEQKSDGTEVRTVSDGKKLIEEITRKDGVVSIVNNLRGYTYTLTEAEE